MEARNILTKVLFTTYLAGLLVLSVLGGTMALPQTMGERIIITEQKIQKLDDSLRDIRDLKPAERLARVESELTQARAAIEELKAKADTQQTTNVVGLIALGAGQGVVILRGRKRRKVEDEGEE